MRIGWGIAAALMAMPALAGGEEARPPLVELYLYSDHSESIRVRGVSYRVDQQVVASRTDESAIDNSTEPLWKGTVKPGVHEIRFVAVYEGKSPVFSYLKLWRFTFHGRVKFDAKPGQIMGIQASIREREGLAVSWDNRPYLTLRGTPRQSVIEIEVQPARSEEVREPLPALPPEDLQTPPEVAGEGGEAAPPNKPAMLAGAPPASGSPRTDSPRGGAAAPEGSSVAAHALRGRGAASADAPEQGPSPPAVEAAAPAPEASHPRVAAAGSPAPVPDRPAMPAPAAAPPGRTRQVALRDGDLPLPPLEEQPNCAPALLHFDTGSADLPGTSVDALARVASCMEANPSANLELNGHADSRGPRELNQDLAHRRARAAAERLESLGVAGRRLKVRSFGEERPVCRELTPECHQRNRRTEMKPVPGKTVPQPIQ
jgi:peptidoglycan-associated lipoprotein